mgnify:CR=1 FL=1
MDFNFGKNKYNNNNELFINENNELDDKLDNIYESIQNIVFNKPSFINEKQINNPKINIDKIIENKSDAFFINKFNSNNINKVNNNKNKYLNIEQYDCNDNINEYKMKQNNKDKINSNNSNHNSKFDEPNNNNLSNYFENILSPNKNNITFKNEEPSNKKDFLNKINISRLNDKTPGAILDSDNINFKKSNDNKKDFLNKINISNFGSKSKFNLENNKNNLNFNNLKFITNDIEKKDKKEKKEKGNIDMINFYNSIKENSPNVFKVNSSEKQLSQKEILRLKLEAFLILKKYYLHRKSKSKWLKRKKTLIIISNKFYRNLLLSRSFYGFILNSKRKSLFELIKNNYVEFRIKELSFNLINILRFCYREKSLENKAFFELTKNKLRRVLNEMKAQMVYNKTVDKYFFTQILNNEAAIEFSKIIIYLGNSHNIKKLCRYEYNINTIIHKEEFSLKQKCFNFLRNQTSMVENELNKEAEMFIYNTIVFNDKKNFIMQLEEKIISNYKIKFLREKLFFIRSKYYVLQKKKWRQKSAIFGPKKELIKNFHNIKLIKKSFKYMNRITKKKKQKIENLQIKNFMKNVKFFYYQCRRKTIESLIIEGIRQKINKYNKLLVMKILLYSKIECLKQKRVMISTRKKYRKKLAFNLLKKNVFLKNYELLSNIKFYYHMCFQIRIKMIKQNKKNNELIFKKGIQKYFIHLVQLKIKLKKQLIEKGKECDNKLKILRKKNFFKKLKDKIAKNKYDNLVYLKHDKIFSFAIGIMNLKRKCNVTLNLKTKEWKKKKMKNFFKIFKSRAISNNIINKKKEKIHRYIMNYNYNSFIQGIKYKISDDKKVSGVNIIRRKFYFKKYLEAINICYKMSSIDNRVDEYYIFKRKKIFLNILKKRYQDSIKYSMLSLRFNEYLIISTFNRLINIRNINQNQNEKNIIKDNNNN